MSVHAPQAFLHTFDPHQTERKKSQPKRSDRRARELDSVYQMELNKAWLFSTRGFNKKRIQPVVSAEKKAQQNCTKEALFQRIHNHPSQTEGIYLWVTAGHIKSWLCQLCPTARRHEKYFAMISVQSQNVWAPYLWDFPLNSDSDPLLLELFHSELNTLNIKLAAPDFTQKKDIILGTGGRLILPSEVTTLV